jgi:hypothetical protein
MKFDKFIEEKIKLFQEENEQSEFEMEDKLDKSESTSEENDPQIKKYLEKKEYRNRILIRLFFLLKKVTNDFKDVNDFIDNRNDPNIDAIIKKIEEMVSDKLFASKAIYFKTNTHGFAANAYYVMIYNLANAIVENNDIQEYFDILQQRCIRIDHYLQAMAKTYNIAIDNPHIADYADKSYLAKRQSAMVRNLPPNLKPKLSDKERERIKLMAQKMAMIRQRAHDVKNG